MGKASRDKGKRGEREVAQLLKDRGIHHDRTLDGRNQIHGDILLRDMALEVRRREQVSIVKWSREHEEEVPDHLIAAVAYRTNGEPWRISLPLDDFLSIIKT